jgi:threonine dehydrogenase-like Zn-dependent dehydrogenase
MTDAVEELRALTGGEGYDDVFVFAPVVPVVEQADALLAFDGCLNFFAGPAKTDFKVPFNFYNVHYAYHHVVGTSGGNADDMNEAIAMMSQGLDPAGLITHIGGINAVIDTTMNLPTIPGGKKLIYTHIDLPLTPIADFEALGKDNPLFAELHKLCAKHNGLWNPEAEGYLLEELK